MSSIKTSKLRSAISAGLVGLTGLISSSSMYAEPTSSQAAQSTSQPTGSARVWVDSVDDIPSYTFALGSKLGPNASLDQFNDLLRVYDFEKSTVIGLKGSTNLFGIPVVGTIYGQESKDPSVVSGFGSELLVGPFLKGSKYLPEGMNATFAYQQSDIATDIGAGVAFNLDSDTVLKFRFDNISYEAEAIRKGKQDYSQVFGALTHGFSDKDYAGVAVRLTDSDTIGNTFNAAYLHFNDDISFRVMGSYTDAKTDSGFVDVVIAENSTLKPGSLNNLLNVDLINTTGGLNPRLLHPGIGNLDYVFTRDRTTDGFAFSARTGFDEKTDATPYNAEIMYVQPIGESAIAGGFFVNGDLSDSDMTRVGVRTFIDFALPLDGIVDKSALRLYLGAGQLLKTNETEGFGGVGLRVEF